MTENNASKTVLVNRLKRIEGQVRGLEKMVENGRECEEVIIQLAAVRSAIESAGALILNNYMKLCLTKNEQREEGNIDSLARSIAVWGRVRVGE